MSEWSLSNSLGREKTNAAFQSHWQNWFTQGDVDMIKSYGLNTIRIPLPFWIIEQLVDTATEPYAQGGLDELVSLYDMTRPSVPWLSFALLDPWSYNAE